MDLNPVPFNVCPPLLAVLNPPPVLPLYALSPPGFLSKYFKLSLPTKPAGVERKLRMRNGRPVMSPLKGLSPLENFPQ